MANHHPEKKRKPDAIEAILFLFSFRSTFCRHSKGHASRRRDILDGNLEFWKGTLWKSCNEKTMGIKYITHVSHLYHRKGSLGFH